MNQFVDVFKHIVQSQTEGPLILQVQQRSDESRGYYKLQTSLIDYRKFVINQKIIRICQKRLLLLT